MLTRQQTKIAIAILENNPAYKDMREGFPLFAKAVDLLPDTSGIRILNPIVRDVLNDVIESARYLSAFFKDEMPPANQLRYHKLETI